MGIICEFELQSADLPLCGVARELDSRLIVDTVVSGTTGEPALVFSATDVDTDALESALLGDDSVVEFVAIDSAIVKSRYRATLETDYVEMYTQLVDGQTYPMGALVTEHGWKVSTQFADRTDLEAFRDACQSSSVTFRPHRLCETEHGGDDYGLTVPQREALLTAHRLGYFAVPRAADLEELAAELDVTTSAVSERLRRGTEQLIGHTIASTER
ncbi:helix-turn-helix domain-containing protein [Haloarchaeobius iranensis]|uniref:GAF and HTH_10 associated domain-containing protein n=2 Tax=Haloarchaeobius iranensis TaxID=996166 RepID=A0A1G9X216_9EURY|nr:helix-turn-helix domain-containing protein [Haloarchaeobius iranensis]SDM90506.1 GAF and HTH_10 associated domain-containing protein [Haloarchaeobius iranensis]